MNSSASAPSFTHTSLLARLLFFSARMQSSASVGLSSTSRISTSFTVLSMSSLLYGKSKIHRRAFIDLALRPHSTAKAADDAHDDGEPDADAFEFGYGMQTLEHAKQLIGIPHIEAYASVFNKVNGFTSFDGSAHPNPGRVLGTGELDGVGQQ